MLTNTQRNSPAYWEERLTKMGLSVNAGCGLVYNRTFHMAQTELEEMLSMEGPKHPDLKDIIEYKRDHLEAA